MIIPVTWHPPPHTHSCARRRVARRHIRRGGGGTQSARRRPAIRQQSGGAQSAVNQAAGAAGVTSMAARSGDGGGDGGVTTQRATAASGDGSRRAAAAMRWRRHERRRLPPTTSPTTTRDDVYMHGNGGARRLITSRRLSRTDYLFGAHASAGVPEEVASCFAHACLRDESTTTNRTQRLNDSTATACHSTRATVRRSNKISDANPTLFPRGRARRSPDRGWRLCVVAAAVRRFDFGWSGMVLVWQTTFDYFGLNV